MVPVQGEHRATLLVVEDDDDLREIVILTLRGRGYRILDAANGPDALAHLVRGDRIDLLLTDVILPGGLSGPDVANRVRALKPELPVLFMSGYTADTLKRHETAGDAVLIHKPFDPENLVRHIDELIAGAGRSS